MSSPPQKQQQKKQRRRQHRRSATSTSSKSKFGGEDLLSPSEATKNIKNLLITAIDEIADTLKQIPRAPASASSSTSNDSRSELNEIDENSKRFTLGEKKPKPQRRNEKIGLMSSSPPSQSTASSLSIDSEQCSECGCVCLPLPYTHGVFGKEQIYVRDRFLMCHGKNMYTREIFTANGEPLKPNLKKLDKLRGVQTPAISAKPSSRDRQPQQQPTISTQKINPNTIIIQNIEEDAKGVTLKFNIKMIKPDGTPKMFDFAVEMPDFEPNMVKVGHKTAILE